MDLQTADCRWCRYRDKHDVVDALGHDELGHRAYLILCRAGYFDAATVRGLTDEQLLDLPQFGKQMLARVREQIGPKAGRGRV